MGESKKCTVSIATDFAPLDEEAEKCYTLRVMFPSNEIPNNGFGTPPPGDAIFESAFEEFDMDAIDDEMIAAAAAAEERNNAYLTVGLHFFEGLKAI